jgi:antitoxin component HigA of HigAB toxin-antitoxin module
MNDIKPIRSEADYEAALAEIERLWGARAGTPEGDRLDVLATLMRASITHSIRLTQSKRSNSEWSNKD